jgi:monovalent cation/hydrogen antiporter
MTALEILPFILFIVVIATAIAERINIPYPLVLVIAGILVGLMPGIPNWHPPSNMVLPVFLPPILFAAARTISWRDIRSNMNNIVSLSVILVLVNTFAIAGVIYWIIPKIHFASALVLGAIISPTDAVAATSILSKMHVRQSIIRTIEVESLFNDAAGIVLYKMAVLFVFMGSLDMHELGLRSILVGAGGVVIGLLFSYFTNLIVEQFLSNSENNLPIIMSLILAYVAYLFAERLGASGVLAVVAAGLYHKKPKNRSHPIFVWRRVPCGTH